MTPKSKPFSEYFLSESSCFLKFDLPGQKAAEFAMYKIPA